MNVARLLNAHNFIVVVTTFLFFTFSPVGAVEDVASTLESTDESDSLEVSLLTCSPGTDLYAMFGHSAIRVKNVNSGVDIAFNYGMFDYDSDNFIYRFVKGETDYVLGAEESDNFFFRYGMMGNEVVEQILNIESSEKAVLFDLLRVNYLPDNRMYRYNFLYDNCTTRARDIIEKAIWADIDYGCDGGRMTYREILHSFTSVSPWAEFGIDMLLGAEVDRVAGSRGQMFIPSIYSQMLDSATWNGLPVVGEKRIAVNKGEMAESFTFPVTPLVFFWCFFGFMLLMSLFDFLKMNLTLWVDAVVLIAQGAAGLIVAFLFFFSEHPAVGTNWLVAVFNPMPLVLMYWMLKCKSKRVTCWLNTANLAVLALFTLAIPFLPQVLNPAMLPLVLTLLLRALVGECVVRRRMASLPSL